MEIKVLSLKEINEGPFSTYSIQKAWRMEVKKDYSTPIHKCFIVLSDENEHYVMFKKEKDSWSCDCKWFSNQGVNTGKYCSHILAVHIFLNSKKEG